METKKIQGGICAPIGFKAAGVHCGIRKNRDKLDLALIVSERECSAAAVYTQNKVKGAPIDVTKANIANGKAWGYLCNSGNANTCNPNGEKLALDCCALAAEATGLSSTDFIVASTGVIGQPMPLAPFAQGIPQAAAKLSPNGSGDAAEAIMTTDTHRKEYAVEFTLSGCPTRIAAICKGSGMINPNMATMLAFITTDAAITPTMLQKALSSLTVETLNQISIDGDTSTNDMAAILANGMAGNALINSEDENYIAFCTALQEVCIWICREIAADGEGATKLLECKVSNAPSKQIALDVAKTVISSDLLKAAMYGADANWGRILCAIGYTPGDFSINGVTVSLASEGGRIMVCENAAYYPFDEDDAYKVLSKREIQILVDMHSGTESGAAWGCDLTYDYVRINGDYRT